MTVPRYALGTSPLKRISSTRAGLNGQDSVMRMIYTQQVPVDLSFSFFQLVQGRLDLLPTHIRTRMHGACVLLACLMFDGPWIRTDEMHLDGLRSVLVYQR